MDTLYACLHRWMAQPFVWGVSDCSLAVADYLVALGYADPAADLRGQYDNAASCHRLTGWLRDPVAAVRPRFETIGLVPTTEPQRGDVGVIRIRAEGAVTVVTAVCLGENWAVKGEHRVTVGQALDVLAAWSVSRG